MRKSEMPKPMSIVSTMQLDRNCYRLSGNTINIRAKGDLTKKLQPRWAGPFKLVERIGTSAYKLELPPSMPVHPVFHIGLLKPWTVNSRQQPPPHPILIDGIEEYQIEAIVSHRFAKRGKA